MLMGQFVPSVKDKVPRDESPHVNDSWRMSNLMTPTEFEELFVARTKALRELSGRTQMEMATLLGVPHETYKKYETRSPLPHKHVERFAALTNVTIEFLLTGRHVAGKGPYPDVPGPHDLKEWRKLKVDISVDNTQGKPTQKREGTQK